MEIREINPSADGKKEWEDFLQTCAEKSFLHSWNWGEFSTKTGKIWRFGIYETERLISVALILKVSARRGKFLFIPHGPVSNSFLKPADKQKILELLIRHLENITKEEKVSFLRIAPIWEKNLENSGIFEDSAFRPAPIHMHPEITWELGINVPEQELLANMRKTTRYLIRQAEKNKDIEIIQSQDIKDLELFWPVYRETAKRHSFVVFSKKYLQDEFEVFSKDNQISLFLGKYKGQVVSAAIFVFWQNICFYHHSGSLSKYAKIPVSYLLQWFAINEAKKRGCKIYNFWGISPIKKTAEDLHNGNILESLDKKHPWYGLSMFKIGFGGCAKEYIRTQDLVISPKYWINYIIETLRKRKRNL